MKRVAVIAVSLSFVLPTFTSAATVKGATLSSAVSARRAARIERTARERALARPLPSLPTLAARRAGERPSARRIHLQAVSLAEPKGMRPVRTLVRTRPKRDDPEPEPEEIDIPAVQLPPLTAYPFVLQRLLDLMNEERARHGLSPLSRNPLLDRAAQGYTDDMLRRSFFSHVSPDGTTFSERIRSTGYPGEVCPKRTCSAEIFMGENLAQGYGDPAEVLADWLASPGHRVNILSPVFTEVGLGLSGEVWSQEFGHVEVEFH